MILMLVIRTGREVNPVCGLDWMSDSISPIML